MDKMPKKYLYVNSKQILSDAIIKQKDVYFYDDTHWSPWASKLIANEIHNIIRRNDSSSNALKNIITENTNKHHAF